MSAVRLGVLLTLMLTLVAGSALAGEAADTDLDILRDTIRANKKALVAVNLPLTDEEAARFWPVYDRYQGELRGVNDRLVKVIKDYTAHYRDLSNDDAKKLVGDYLGVEEDRARIRRSYLGDFSKALPGRKVARFYQIENKMDAVVKFGLAGEVPLVSTDGG